MSYEEDAGEITIALVGDALVTRRLRVHREPAFVAMAEILRSADVTMANSETLFHDFEGTPVADSGPYGTYVACEPAVVDDLRWLGIDMVSTANNHCVDYGETGLLANLDNLRAHGMPSAGTGRTLTEAAAPTYLDTAKGRVALLAVTLTMPPGDHRAGEPRGVIRARPGANVQRRSVAHTVPAEAFAALRELGGGLDLGRQFRAEDDAITMLGRQFRLDSGYSTTETLHPDDLALNQRWIRDARRLADWVVVSAHCHEAGASRDVPPTFAVDFARHCVDAGADVVFGHGPHLDRGIEIYQDKPILYALGNFILHNESITRQPWDLAARYGLGTSATTADIYDARSSSGRSTVARDPLGLQSAVALVRFRDWELVEVELVPLDLGVRSSRSVSRGRPMLADGDLSARVLDRFARLSQQLGSDVAVRGDRGFVTP